MRDLATLPKTHLHVHLEGAIRWSTLREIAATHGVAVPGGVDGHMPYTGFADFFARNDLVRGCLRTAGDFRRVAEEFCADEAACGTRYAEVSFTAAAHGERLGDPEMPLAAVLEGLAAGRELYGVDCAVVLDHSRRRPVERAWRTLDLATRYAGSGVVAVGLAGDETYPLKPFVPVFAAAGERGLRVVHHAGEACGAASVAAAVRHGHAERIGHGIRVLDDPAVVDLVRERGVPLEVCPTSNVALGFAPSLAAHPLPRLRAAGLPVTLNADIPAMVGTSLAEEYTRVRDAFGYDDEAMAGFARAGIDAAFAAPHVKARLHRAVDGWLAAPVAGPRRAAGTGGVAPDGIAGVAPGR